MAKVTHHPQYRIYLHRRKQPGWPDKVELRLLTKVNGMAMDLKVLFSCYESPESADSALEKLGVIKSTLLAADKDNLFFVEHDNE